MVVDDSRFMRKTLRDILTDGGFRDIIEARDGYEALSLMKRYRVDIATVDIVMPKMNGLTLIKKIKSVSPGTAVVVCSALGQRSMVKRALELGAQEFIVKPFRRSEVITVFESLRYMPALQKIEISV